MTSKPYSNKHPAGVQKDSQPGQIKNRRSALKWLRDHGFKCGRGTVYRHVAEGRLQVSPDGTIDATALELYALTHLQKTAPAPDCAGLASLLEIEKRAQIELLQTRQKKLAFELAQQEKRFLDKDKVYTAWAVRLGFLETHLKNLFRTNAEPWLAACGASPARGGTLFGLMEKELDKLLEYLGNLEELNVVVKKRPADES